MQRLFSVLLIFGKKKFDTYEQKKFLFHLDSNIKSILHLELLTI